MRDFFQLRESLLLEKTIELAGVTLQHMEHCPGAVAAFKRNLKDGASEADVAKAAKAVDAYLAIEDKAIKAGKATNDDVEEMEDLIDRAENIISDLGLEGHTYHEMHLDRVEDMVEDEDEDEDDLDEAVSADKKPETYTGSDGKPKVRMVPTVKEKTLTPAEKKKREEIAKAIERENPNMPMDKKMAIATAQAKKVAESYEDRMPASPDEKSMAMRQAKFIRYVGEELMEHLAQDNDFPEWMQNKLSAFHQKAKDMHATMSGDYEDNDDVNEAAPKIKHMVDPLKKEREKNRAHDAAMGRTATGRKQPQRAMTSTQRSMASMRKEEAEQIDELSKKTLGSYIKKASSSAVGIGSGIGADAAKNRKAHPDDTRQLRNRMKGVQRATDRLTKEETELDESITKMSNARLKYHATKNFPHGSYTKAEIDSEHKRRQKTEPNYHSVKPSLNEISDKMKDRYIQKSMGDHQHANAVRKDAEARGDSNLATKMRDRMKKRNQGMTRAFGGERS